MSGSARRVLLVEDDASTVEALGHALEVAGFETRTAPHGRAALEVLSDGFLPHVIVLDLSMPVMSGPELHRALRQHPEWAHIPIVIVTGDARDAAPLAVEAVLTKPFDLDELLNLVRRHAAPRQQPEPTVLVVEDDEAIRDAMAELLERSGFQVVQASDGRVALELLEAGLLPDLVVTDLLMPRVSGWDLVQALKRHAVWADLPVVVVSAASPPTTTRGPVEAVLPKPVAGGELIACVGRALQKAALRARR